MPEMKCKICNKSFSIKPSQEKLGYGVYCSMTCKREGQKTGKNIKCDICGKETWKMLKDIKKSKSGKFFCGKSCQTKWRNEFFSGEKHYFWKGGEYTYRNNLIKADVERICKRCGNDDVRVLDAHHIDKDRQNSNIENLVWLCKNCHHLLHNYC